MRISDWSSDVCSSDLPHHLHHLLAHGGTVLPLRLTREDLGAEVGGQDDEGVAEVDGAALAVGQAAVVQHLQQDVEDVGVCLLELVEQHHLRSEERRVGQEWVSKCRSWWLAYH